MEALPILKLEKRNRYYYKESLLDLIPIYHIIKYDDEKKRLSFNLLLMGLHKFNVTETLIKMIHPLSYIINNDILIVEANIDSVNNNISLLVNSILNKRIFCYNNLLLNNG